MKLLMRWTLALGVLTILSCNKDQQKDSEVAFDSVVGQFADIKVLRYQIPGFEDLTLKEQKLVYYECKNVQKSLQRHIQDAIQDKYLKSLIDKDNQLINTNIPDVLKYLFDTCGKVLLEEVKQKETEIRAISFHPANPMILLYNAIKKLKP